MTKQEALEALKRTGQLDGTRKSPEWTEAFRLYNEANPRNKKNMSCGMCFTTVRNWLKA